MPTINYGARARIGMLLPSGNQAAEPQFHAMLPAGVAMHTTRLKLMGSSDAELLAMVDGVEDAARLVADSDPDLILFHCTAVTTFDPALEESIKSRITKVTGKPSAATSEALVGALRAVGAKRIVMLSPYIDAVNRREEAFLTHFGFEILDSTGLGKITAAEMMSVAPEEWKQLARAHRNDQADAYLISCTTVRSSDVVEEIERELGRPVVTSNTATAWHCLRKLGINDRIDGFGRLLREH